jgi:hypothetical protein
MLSRFMAKPSSCTIFESPKKFSQPINSSRFLTVQQPMKVHNFHDLDDRLEDSLSSFDLLAILRPSTTIRIMVRSFNLCSKTCLALRIH